jgi:hypothetical protein
MPAGVDASSFDSCFIFFAFSALLAFLVRRSAQLAQLMSRRPSGAQQ